MARIAEQAARSPRIREPLPVEATHISRVGSGSNGLAAKPISPVETALSDLAASQNDLDVQLNRLAERLGPALSDTYPAEDCAKEPNESAIELVRRINAAGIATRRQAETVRSLIDRLAL